MQSCKVKKKRERERDVYVCMFVWAGGGGREEQIVETSEGSLLLVVVLCVSHVLGDLLDEESSEAAPNVYELHLLFPSVRVILGPVHVVRRAWDVEHLVVQRVTVRTSTIQPLFGLQTNIYKKQKKRQKKEEEHTKYDDQKSS